MHLLAPPPHNRGKLYWFYFFDFIAMRVVYRSDYILRANLDILIICFGNFSLLSSLCLTAPNQRFSNYIENDYSTNVETSWQKSNGVIENYFMY